MLFEVALVVATLGVCTRARDAEQSLNEQREQHEEDADQADVDLHGLAERENHAGDGIAVASTTMNRLMAAFYDRILKSSQTAGLADTRREALREARGEVLEIGAGTGLNLAAYPREGITRLVLTEPNAAMGRHIEDKRAIAPLPFELVEAPGERLPFDDASFDTVVGTLVLCEPGDPGAVVAEVARVLRPGGRYLFVEHVRSEDPRLARSQDRWAPVWRTVSGGCNCNRRTLATIEKAGLDVERKRLGEFPKSPKITRPLLVGSAVRGDVL